MCPHSGQGYFDPSNAIYATALRFLAPRTLNRDWNIETLGDICESLMGFEYQLRHTQRPDPLNMFESVADVSFILERTTSLTYRLYKIAGEEFYAWCNCIVSRAAHFRNVCHVGESI